MDRLDNDYVYLAMQYLRERKFHKALHWLESESGIYCDIDYVQSLITTGDWDKVESYLGGFKIRVGEDPESMAILYEIKRQPLLEAVRQERDEEALLILTKQMVGLETFFNKTEMANLLIKDKAGREKFFGKYTDIVTSRDKLGVQVREMIEKHPRLAEKCRFPEFDGSRLSFLCKQSLYWQHSKCQNKNRVVQYTSLLENHRCRTPNPVLAQVLSPSLKAPFLHGSQQPHNVVPAVTVNLPLMTHTRVGPSFTGLNAGDGQGVSSLVDNLPKHIVSSTNMGSVVTCLDFNPMHEDLLAIGTNTGEIFLWKVGSKFRDTRINFSPHKTAYNSPALRAALISRQDVCATRVVWSPAGDRLGVAYSKALVHTYTYQYGGTPQFTLEMEAHEGTVTDVAFFLQNKKLLIVTCGQDAFIKIWYAADGEIVSTFKAPASVLSVCVLQKQQMHVIYAADSLGGLTAWRLAAGSVSECFTINMPRCSFSEVRCNSSSLFSSGFNQEKHPLVREWTYTEDNVALSLKSEYLGVGGGDAIKFFFDSNDKIVTVGFDWCVKFWEIDRVQPLHVTTTNGGLPQFPVVRLSKHGTFLAVSALKNGLKVLGNAKGYQLANSNQTAGASTRLYSSENIRKPNTLSSNVASFSAAGASMGFNSSTVLNARPTFSNQPEDSEIRIMGETNEINVPSQMRSLRLSSDSSWQYQISRLLYSKTGCVLVALTSTASHKVWRWGAGMASPSLEPETVGISMDNETRSSRMEKPVACLAISNDTELVLSASGGRVSIFKLSSFKREASIIPPPSVATCLMFDPRDNNTIAVGLSDASVQIYDVRQNKVLQTLRGHGERVTGLAYFIVSKVLISSGADNQLCVWNLETWDNNTNKFLEIPDGRNNTPRAAGTRLHSNNDQTRLLVIHETHVATHHPTTLDRFFEWHQPPVRGLITDAVFSCDGKSIFVGILDGSVCVLEACQLSLKCRINYSAYVPSNRSAVNVPPMAIAAHPCNPHQIALGLSDGGVYILEPLESDQWGTDPLASTRAKEAKP